MAFNIALCFVILSLAATALCQTIDVGSINAHHTDVGQIWCNITDGLPLTTWINETGGLMTTGCTVEPEHTHYIVPHASCDSVLGYLIFNVTFDRHRDCQNLTCYNAIGLTKTLELLPSESNLPATVTPKLTYIFNGKRDFSATCTLGGNITSFPPPIMKWDFSFEDALSDAKYETSHTSDEPGNSVCRLQTTEAKVTGVSKKGDFSLYCSVEGVSGQTGDGIDAPWSVAAACGTLVAVILIIILTTVGVMLFVKKRSKTSRVSAKNTGTPNDTARANENEVPIRSKTNDSLEKC